MPVQRLNYGMNMRYLIEFIKTIIKDIIKMIYLLILLSFKPINLSELESFQTVLNSKFLAC